MKSFKIAMLMAFISLFFTSCLCDDTEIDPELHVHVDNFFYEAEHRGIHLPRPCMKVKFKNLKGKQGHTNFFTSTIFIDNNSANWKHNAEALVFHELGHFILGRDHRNDYLKGYCLSIMTANGEPVYDVLPDAELYNRRKYYIDELFNFKTPLPQWLMDKR